MKILVVCGAGASSTFVAQRVRRAARERGFDYSASAGTLRSLEIDLDSADIVLIGPHLTQEIEHITVVACARGAAVSVLPEDIFGDLDGSRTLAIVRDTLANPSSPLRNTHDDTTASQPTDTRRSR